VIWNTNARSGSLYTTLRRVLVLKTNRVFANLKYVINMRDDIRSFGTCNTLHCPTSLFRITVTKRVTPSWRSSTSNAIQLKTEYIVAVSSPYSIWLVSLVTSRQNSNLPWVGVHALWYFFIYFKIFFYLFQECVKKIISIYCGYWSSFTTLNP